MSAEARPVFSQTMPVRWGDMDAYGHVNNTVYFRFFEEARIQWLGSLSLTAEAAGQGPIIINTSATFLRELNYPTTVRVEVLTGKAGNTSIESFYRILDDEDGSVYAEGAAKIVWFDHSTRKSTPLPDNLRALAAT